MCVVFISPGLPDGHEVMLNNMAQMDYQLQPLPPCESSEESMEIYKEHLKVI